MMALDPEVSRAHTRRERVLQLLRSRTQADPKWTVEALAECVYCSPRTLQRDIDWLREFGYLPSP